MWPRDCPAEFPTPSPIYKMYKRLSLKSSALIPPLIEKYTVIICQNLFALWTKTLHVYLLFLLQLHHHFAGLDLPSCPVQKYTIFVVVIENPKKQLHICSLLICVHALSLKSEISPAYCELNTLFELAREAGQNALPAKTQRNNGRKHSFQRDGCDETVRYRVLIQGANEYEESNFWRVALTSFSVMASCSKTHSTKLVAFAPGVPQHLLQVYSSFARSPLQLKCCSPWVVPFSQLPFLSGSFLFHPPPLHKSPCRLSYLLMMFLQRPSSFLMSATSCRRAAFSRSRKAARTVIWFSFSRRASRERLAASLFFKRRLQYFSSFCSSGTSILRAFLIIG